MAWHLAPSLVRLRSEINKRWPNRDKRSDGSIGDSRHSSRVSDHNPNSRRSVNAIDVDKDGIDPYFVVARAIKHPSTNYVIFNRKIWSRKNGFRARRYTGSNPHTMHVHISILQSVSAENSTKAWLGTSGPPSKPPVTPSYPTYPGEMRLGSRGTRVRTLQTRLKARGYSLPGGVDGVFGPGTKSAVLKFQKFARLTQDGIVGPATWKALWVLKIT